MLYSKKVMEHFQNPRNVGVIKNADGVAEIGNPVCGDLVTFYIKVKDNRIEDIKFQTLGCGAAIAVSSIVTEMAKGRTIEEARKITNVDAVKELGGLPKHKFHCSNLGASALQAAIDDYQNRQKTAKKDVSAKPIKKDIFSCPYCEGPVEGLEDYCKRCQVELKKCYKCGNLMKKGEDKCPHCGASQKET